MEEGPNRTQKQQKVGESEGMLWQQSCELLSHPVAAHLLPIGKWTDMNCLNKSKLILHKIMCQLQITVHHSLFIYKTSHEPVPTAQGSLRSPTPSAQIQGVLGALPPDPWLHPNISLGYALF